MSAVPIVVVAAVIEVDDAFLITLRPDGTHLAGHWEFPGGKCDEGESHEAALRRELREELDVDAEVGALVHHVTHAYPTKTVALHFFQCVLRGTPRPMIGQQMRWVPRGELSALPFPGADAGLIRLLAQAPAAPAPPSRA